MAKFLRFILDNINDVTSKYLCGLKYSKSGKNPLLSSVLFKFQETPMMLNKKCQKETTCILNVCWNLGSNLMMKVGSFLIWIIDKCIVNLAMLFLFCCVFQFQHNVVVKQKRKYSYLAWGKDNFQVLL